MNGYSTLAVLLNNIITLSIVVCFAEANSQTEVLYYENFDLENVVTPVDIEELEKLLIKANYDAAKTSYLIDRFKNCFDIGYRGPQEVKLKSPNLKF